MAKTRYCSFCGKADHEVFYIVEGPSVGICDECIPVVADVVQEQRARIARKEPFSPRFRTLEEYRAEVSPRKADSPEGGADDR